MYLVGLAPCLPGLVSPTPTYAEVAVVVAAVGAFLAAVDTCVWMSFSKRLF